MKIKSELRLQLAMLGLGIGPLLFGAMGMITFANNISAALVNGLFLGIILSAIVNIIAIKLTK